MAKILIIEDEDMLRDEVSEWLTFEGYEVFKAKDGVAGLECAILNLPDLIVCDIMMPRLDGYGVLLETRANPKTAAIPFIFMTAKVTTEDIRRGMVLGADDYLTKPFRRMDLLQTIQTRLAKSAVLEQNHQHDIEQLKTALEQEQDQRLLKANMVAMFSHDFRNPLASIMSSISLVRDYADRMDEDRRRKHLNRAEASVRQLIEMLDDMIVISRMETGNLDFKPEPLNIENFLQDIVENFQILYGETHKIVFESRFNDTVMADSRLLHQIASNLISNAIKYSPDGSEVSVSLERRDDQVVLTVQDQGIGIPETDQLHLFTAFQRASNVGEVYGTGLGLTIAKQAADLHGGTIHFESQVGSGTTVTVHIPMVSNP